MTMMTTTNTAVIKPPAEAMIPDELSATLRL